MNWLRKKFRYDYTNVMMKIVVINILVFFLTTFRPIWINYLALNVIFFQMKHFFWTPVTYMFVHANFTHILFNMVFLFLFGPQVERQIGSKEFAMFYLFCGVAAGFFSLGIYILTNAYMVFLMGASGAIYAILYLFALLNPNETLYLFGLIPIPAPLLVVLFLVIEIFSAFSSPGSPVAHMTHLAGLLFAFLYAWIRLGLNPVKIFGGSSRRRWPRN